jgi:hypothetical protein
MTVVCQLSPRGGGGIYRVNGTSTDLERSIWCQAVAGRSGGSASTNFLHRLSLSFSCRRVAKKARAEPLQTMAVP